MDTLQCIESRMSSRKYTSDSIPEKVINDILNAARWAPSPKNRQPWRFVILEGDLKDNIVKICNDELYISEKHIDYLMNNESVSELNTFKIIDEAPVLILVFNVFPSEQALGHRELSFDYMNIQAIGAAIQNILLRATELGIGSLWVGDIISAKKRINNLFPNIGQLISGVVLGYTQKDESHYAGRMPISELVIDTKIKY